MIGVDTSLHPICLLSRTDTQTFSLYHSFFLIDNTEDASTIFRVPARRSRLEDVETGVRYFITGLTAPADGAFGVFVITTSDASRFYALWKGSPDYLFVAVSIFPLITFSRKLFELLTEESPSTISPVLNTLCEFPVVSCACMDYRIRLQAGSLMLSFNALGLVDDDDMNMIALRMLTPQMMVDAWEALIVENKVLVVSSVAGVVPYCCEFLRRLVLPLVVINTYVPFLPEDILSAIEAPFPYLLGAQTSTVYDNHVDLSDTYVVDLDAHVVRPPKNAATTTAAPATIKSKVTAEINSILMEPLAAWLSRPMDPPKSAGSGTPGGGVQVDTANGLSFSGADHPHSLDLQAKCSSAILKCFIRLNLSLFAARHCDVRAFYRRCERSLAPPSSPCHSLKLPKHIGPDGRISSMGFSYRSGVVCGCMQLLNERKDIDVLQFLPCWIEMDSEVLAVHEYADEMPLIFVLIKDIVAVSPSPAEPEGHVFDLQIASQMTYRFAATDPDSRKSWISEIEKITRMLAPPRVSVQLTGHLSSASTTFSDADSQPDYTPGEGSDYTDEAFTALSKFRCQIVQTQMVSYYKSRSEFHEYEGILHEKDLGAENLTTGDVTDPGLNDILPSPMASPVGGYRDGGKIDSNGSTEKEVDDATGPVRMGVPAERSSRFILDVETTMCSEPVIDNIKLLWGLYVSGELNTEFSSATPQGLGDSSTLQERRNGVTIRRNSVNTESSYWLCQSPMCQAASLAFLSKHPRDYSSLQMRKKNASVEILHVDAADKLQQQSSSLLSSILRPFQTKQESDIRHSVCAAQDDFNTAIKEEMIFRNAAGELIQRIAATHRQCETELRKVLVQMKMKVIADIIDINSNTTDPQQRVVIDIDIARAARSVMSELGHHPYPGDTSAPTAAAMSASWEDALHSWGGVISPVPMQRSASADSHRMRASTAMQLQDMIFRMPSLEAVDDLGLLHLDSSARIGHSTAMSPPSLFGSGMRESIRISSMDDDYFLGEGKERGSKKTLGGVKFLYFSPESDTIRNAVKGLIKEQLDNCDVEGAASNLTATTPLLQAMCGYACARCENGDAAAIEAYAEGALGDQVRIMRSLVNVFLAPVRQHSENSLLFSRSSEEKPVKTDQSLLDVQHIEAGEKVSLVLSCAQVKRFLKHAVDFGDMMGLQAVRLLTELLHKCLSRRMAERIVEQAQNLPIHQSSGDSVLNEFKREVAYGIYSRNRVSLSNMQPSFIWVNGDMSKKSDVLNESVLCTMSASKPCELSIQLLNALREMLRAGCDHSGEGLDGEQLALLRHMSGTSVLLMPEAQREKISVSSAFRSFEVQSCQLQMVDVASMDDNAKTLFFSNMFNVITVHALIARGYAGTGFYDKCNFLRVTKYNISGQIFSLLEIEHTILRAQSSSPNSIVGPFIHVSDRNLKTSFALKKPVPLVSFTLFTATLSSPQLTTLWDPSTVETELKRAASAYILAHSRVDIKNKTLMLPEIFKWYWRDFGGSKKAVLNTVMHLLGRETTLFQDIVQYVDQSKPHIGHIPFDWRYAMVI